MTKTGVCTMTFHTKTQIDSMEATLVVHDTHEHWHCWQEDWQMEKLLITFSQLLINIHFD